MIRNKLLAGGAVVVAALVACAVENVRASDYDQSCAKDEDCVFVLELVENGGACTQPCAAVNAKARDKYEAELAEERRDCASVAQPECTARTAVCREGKCAVATPGGADAGAD